MMYKAYSNTEEEMNIYAISDLHFASSINKPMDIFGDHWKNHADKISHNWRRVVEDEDLVLIPGDISWGMNLHEAKEDLKLIHELPGKKILVKGNHDYWWKSITVLNDLFDDMYFIQNNHYLFQSTVFCGTRGWTCPNDQSFTKKDQKIYERELNRLELSLGSIRKTEDYDTMIVLQHFPPTNDRLIPSDFLHLYKKYSVDYVIYGHLHGKQAAGTTLIGRHEEVEYRLVSCDSIDFEPLKII